MNQRRANPHNRCPNCRINFRLCFCEHIKPLTSETKVSLIVHVKELKLTTNTAYFVNKMLPESSQFLVRGSVNFTFEAQSAIDPLRQNLFLYPDENSQELNPTFLANYPGPYNLIVPDGSWSQASKVYKREKGFKDIPTVRLPAGITGEYKLRVARFPEQVSTYEAVAHALGAIENKELTTQMMELFRIFVKNTAMTRQGLREQFLP